jgi:hypothetical protein
MFSVIPAAAFDDSKVVGRSGGRLAGMKAILAEFKPSVKDKNVVDASVALAALM